MRGLWSRGDQTELTVMNNKHFFDGDSGLSLQTSLQNFAR